MHPILHCSVTQSCCTMIVSITLSHSLSQVVVIPHTVHTNSPSGLTCKASFHNVEEQLMCSQLVPFAASAPHNLVFVLLADSEGASIG